MIVYGRITGETQHAWLFRPAYLLDRDPPLGDAVRIPKRDARRGRPLRWANLDALTLARRVPNATARRVWYGRDFPDLPLLSAAGCEVD